MDPLDPPILNSILWKILARFFNVATLLAFNLATSPRPIRFNGSNFFVHRSNGSDLPLYNDSVVEPSTHYPKFGGSDPAAAGTWGQCFKNAMLITVVILTLLFRVKILLYITAILGWIVLYNIRYTNTAVIYCHSTVITKVMLLYSTEWWCDHGM